MHVPRCYPDFEMTKVQLHYRLQRPLTDSDMVGIARVHGHYGIARVQLAPALDRITVDYDASRLTAQDVESILAQAGIPLEPVMA